MTILSSRDLCAIDFIDKLRRPGFPPLKLKGA
jgi:hypothetical protein